MEIAAILRATLAQISPPQLIWNHSWELFLGTLERFGNKSFLMCSKMEKGVPGHLLGTGKRGHCEGVLSTRISKISTVETQDNGRILLRFPQSGLLSNLLL